MVGVDRIGAFSRSLSRLTVYLVFTAALMPVQAVGLLCGRAWVATFPVFYHRWCCRILGFQVRTIGSPAAIRPVLFAANHVSYSDITILGSIIPGSFIEKSEVATWPLFGWLAKLQRTVFIDRRVRSTAAQRDAITLRFARREALILFPEGTSGDGIRVLPFKSALFSAAERGVGEEPVTVQPVSIAYTRLDGLPIGRHYRPFFAWYGDMAMAPHLWALAGLGTIEVVVEFHPPTSVADCGSRKALAAYCERRVAGGAAAALSGRPQPVPPPPSMRAADPAPAARREPVAG